MTYIPNVLYKGFVADYDALGQLTYGRFFRVNFITGDIDEIHFPFLNKCIAVMSDRSSTYRVYSIAPHLKCYQGTCTGDPYLNHTKAFYMDSINGKAVFLVYHNTFSVDLSKIEDMTVTINGSEVDSNYYPIDDKGDGELLVYQSGVEVEETKIGVSYTVKLLPVPDRFEYNYYVISKTDSGGVILNSAPHNSDYIEPNALGEPEGTVYYVAKFFDVSDVEVAPTGYGVYSRNFSNTNYTYSATVHVQGSNDAGVTYGDSIVVLATTPNGTVQYTYAVTENTENSSLDFIDTITFYATDQNNTTTNEVIVSNGDAITTTTAYAPDTAHCNNNLVVAHMDVLDIFGATYTSNIFNLYENCPVSVKFTLDSASMNWNFTDNSNNALTLTTTANGVNYDHEWEITTAGETRIKEYEGTSPFRSTYFILEYGGTIIISETADTVVYGEPYGAESVQGYNANPPFCVLKKNTLVMDGDNCIYIDANTDIDLEYLFGILKPTSDADTVVSFTCEVENMSASGTLNFTGDIGTGIVTINLPWSSGDYCMYRTTFTTSSGAVCELGLALIIN